jgi:SAM-dependent methyltransferase
MPKLKSEQALDKLCDVLPKESYILDIGAGSKQVHARIFRDRGFTVHTADFFPKSTYVGDFNQIEIESQYDAVWASHCLEHQLNVSHFLRKVHSVVKLGGYAAITVPPLKHEIVGGHVSLWNPGLLIYNLVLAGFDCSNVMIKQYDYNISAIVKKTTVQIPFDQLEYDTKDLVTLNRFFPTGLDYGKNCTFSGEINQCNWQ